MFHSQPVLLHRLPLQPDESLPSWLIRLAQANSYHSAKMVLQLCRERLPRRDSITQPTRTATYQVLAELTRVAADELYAASVHRFAATLIPPAFEAPPLRLPSAKTVPLLRSFFLREHLWSEADVQFCPLCLQTTPYQRLAWLPVAAAVCLNHQCLLVRGCPACAQDLCLEDLLKTHCPHCQLDLTQSPVTYVSQDELGLTSQAQLQAWLGLAPGSEFHASLALPDAPPAVLYHLLDGLRWTLMSLPRAWDFFHQPSAEWDHPLFPCTCKRDLTPAKAYRLYATAFKILLNWPHRFSDFLHAYRRREGSSTHPYIQAEFGYLYLACLQKRWQHPAFHFVQEAFEHYLRDNYPGDALARLRRTRANLAMGRENL